MRRCHTAAMRWIEPLVKDLQASRGRGLVIAGDGQPAVVHALAHAMNDALGNVGATVVYTQTAEAQPMDQRAALRALVNDMSAGAVTLLFIFSANPVYSAPVDLKFGDAMQKVALRVHLGLYEDETAALCHWHIAEAHYLESWSDVRADDGTVTIIQPLIAPLYGGKSAHEVLAALSGGEKSGYDLVRAYWMSPGAASGAGTIAASAPARHAVNARAAAPAARLPHPRHAPTAAPPSAANAASRFDRQWRQWLHDGVVPNTAFMPRSVTLKANFAVAAAARRRPGARSRLPSGPHDSTTAASRTTRGSRSCPKSLTKLTWDNAALISPATADRLRLISGDVVELKQGGRTLRMPGVARAGPGAGHADASSRLRPHARRARRQRHRLQRQRASDVRGAGHSAAASSSPKTGDSYDAGLHAGPLVARGTQPRARRHARRSTTQDPTFAQKMEEAPRRQRSRCTRSPSSTKATRGAWRSIRTSASAATRASSPASAENNIPVVGKAQVMNGREMHWLRIDRYYTGDIENPDTYHQPMPCQQCENAPCEVVCPVAATIAQRRRPERHGLQPLRRHAVLLEQLPVQGAPLQLPALSGLGYAEPLAACAIPTSRSAAAASWRSAPTACSASARRASRPSSRIGRSATAKSSPPARRRARPRRSSSATSTIRTAR